MAEAFIFVFLLFAIAVPIALWVAIENETSDATVVDRADAERIARERGGRGGSRSDAVPNSGTNADADSAADPDLRSDSKERGFDRDRDYSITDRIRDDSRGE